MRTRERKEMSEWISVKERLPDKKGEYLVAVNRTSNGKPRGQTVNTAWYGYRHDGGFHEAITHWMPLPDPPAQTHTP